MADPAGRRFTPRCSTALLPTLRPYPAGALRHDLSAGLVLTAMLVPVGMSYAEAAGLPAITGLYASLVPLVVYALLGTSRLLVLGPDSALAGLIATALLPWTRLDPALALPLAAMLALMTGTLCVLAGCLRLGFVTDLLSRPIRLGYLMGIALTMLITQTPKLLGLSLPPQSLWTTLLQTLKALQQGQALHPAALTGGLTLLVILILQHWCPRWPAILIGLLAGSTLAWGMGWSHSGQLAVVGTLPSGLPQLLWPQVSLAQALSLGGSALAIALVAFADMSVLSRTYAQRLSQPSRTNRELIALGAANLATGLAQGFPITSSASRTPVAELAGARTQLTGLVAALGIALCLWLGTGWFEHIPRSTLAAVIVAASLGLMDCKGLAQLYRLRRSEFLVALACMLGVLVYGVVQGIFIALGVATGLFMWRASKPYDAVLGRIDGVKGYHDVSRHPDARQVPGLLLFRWDAPLFFANQDHFRREVLRQVRRAEKAGTSLRRIVIAAEPITDIDTTAADMLTQLCDHLRDQGVALQFAELKGPVKDRLRAYGLADRWPELAFYPTLGRAVDQYLHDFAVPWVDWQSQHHHAHGDT
jgi:high affinity sulfate transporter 1